MAENKAYVCNRFPSLSIRNKVQFHNGLCVTDDPEAQRLVESNDLWGVHIHPRDLLEGTAVAAPVEPTEGLSPPPPNESPPPPETIEFEHGGVVIGPRGTRRKRG